MSVQQFSGNEKHGDDGGGGCEVAPLIDLIDLIDTRGFYGNGF